MITKQDIKNYSAREDLPGELLIEIIIGKSVDELEGCRQSHTMHPDLSPKDIQKAFPAYKTLSTGIINRFHKEPSTQSHKAIREKLKDAIPLKMFCSWFCNEDLPSFLKKQSKFVLSPQAKIFISLVLGQPLGKAKKQNARHAESNKHKEEIRKIAKKVWKANGTMTIADMVNSDEINQVTDGINYSKGTLRKWVKDLAPSNKSGRRPKIN
jgi:hypothetical protein